MTQCEDGKVRSVQPLELYRSQQYTTAIYRAFLAEKLQALGYEFVLIRAPAHLRSKASAKNICRTVAHAAKKF